MARISASDRRTTLVAATVRLIAREGLAASSTRAIAAEADMPLSTLHYVFESREQLIELAVRNIAADFRMRLDLDAIDFSSVESSIRTAFGQRLHYAREHRDMTLAAYEVHAYAARTHELAGLGVARWSEDLLFIRFLLDLLQVRTRVRLTIDSEVLASMLLVTIEGIMFTWVKTNDDRAVWLGVDAIVTLIESNLEPLADGEEPSTELMGSRLVEELFSGDDSLGAAGGLQREPTE
ncbi:TetR/AcrR family transcriptional regulator [Pseudoclavibacter endophyticus]|nr:TetR family transcriptional regulator [Pseudoclavibacter endophyticus]